MTTPRRLTLVFRRHANAIQISLEALGRHKLRAALGVIGIVIGVAAVTAMLSVAEGARREVIRQVELFGLNNIVLRPRAPDLAASGPASIPGRISFDEAHRLVALLPFTERWSPLVEGFATLSGTGSAVAAAVLAVRPDYQPMMNLRPAAGRLLSALDVERGTRACVLGAALRRTLFGRTDAVGRRVLIDDEPYTVAGVLEARASAGSGGGALAPRDLNAAVLVPATADSFLGGDPVIAEMWLQVSQPDSIVEAGAVAQYAAARLHPNDAGVDVVIPEELLRQRLTAQRTFNVVIGSIAVLSLLVGGIGIMNMMLASVLERTSEIGLRRAVGATAASIGAQFLVESTLMTGSGGVLGVATGACASAVITRYAGWPVHVSLGAVLASLGLSAIVGVFFGTYPARRAAALQPIDALRYE